MPQDILYNINSKENYDSPDRTDIDDLVEAGKALRISLDNFIQTLERLSISQKPPEPSPTTSNPTYVPLPENYVPISKPFSIPTPPALLELRKNRPRQHLRSLHGYKIGDIVKVQNKLARNGYEIPDKHKVGEVVRFNKRFVYFDIVYPLPDPRNSKNVIWHAYEAYRQPENLRKLHSADSLSLESW